MTKNNLAVYGVIDRSGSMAGERWTNAIESFNNYIANLQKEKIVGTVTLVAFDTGPLEPQPYQPTPKWSAGQLHVQTTPFYNGHPGLANTGSNLRLVRLVSNEKISKFKPIDHNVIQPSGMTPLFDASGRVIDEAIDNNAERTVVVIMTDGHENASREYSQAAIKAKVEHVTSKGWEVLFLGANFDVSTYAVNNGLAATKMRNFDFGNKNIHDVGSYMNAFQDLTTSTVAYAKTGAAMNVSADPSKTTKE